MEGLIFLLALLPIALVVLLIVVMVRLGTVTSDLREVRRALANVLERLERGGSVVPPTTEKIAEPQPVSAPPPFVPLPAPPAPVVVPLAAPAPPVWVPKAEPIPEPIRTPIPAATAPPVLVEDPGNVVVAGSTAHTPPPEPPKPRSTFSSRNPDLEKFIGENLINKIGIAVLVVGIGFLLNYAIDEGYINQAAQALIGLLCGGILMFVAHRLRERFRAFSSVLLAGGIAVFYFTVAFAFHEYHLIGQTGAFVSMVGITALSVAFTLAYDRKELAVIALLGGFLTPFMVATGEGNYRALFTYLLILDMGMLVLANYKKWPIINVLAFGLSWLLFGIWAVDDYGDLITAPVWPALAFATGFYAVFATMILWYDLRHRTPFGPLDYSMFLANTALYFGTGLLFLADTPLRVSGLFTAGIGMVNLLLAWRFFRREQVPRNLVYLLIGIVLTFLSLAAPVQLEGSHITLFWAAECVLLLWFSQRSGLKLVEVASVLVMGAMFISLFQDLVIIHFGDTTLLRPLLNKGWITGMAVSIALFLYVRLLRGRDPSGNYVLPTTLPRTVVEVLLATTLFAVNYLEVLVQFSRFFNPLAVDMALAAYVAIFILLLDLVLRKRGPAARTLVLVLLALRLVVQVMGYYGASRIVLSERLQHDPANWFPLLHLVNFALAVVMLVCVAMHARALLARTSFLWSAYLWSLCTLLVVMASQELDHIMILMGWHPDFTITYVLNHARKWGYPILWGAGSFLFMIYGMRTKQRTVRIIALALFGITLLKLFLFDIRGVSEGGKVAAFISLGVLLLVVSFLYQRLKGLLIDDSTSAKTSDDAQV